MANRLSGQRRHNFSAILQKTIMAIGLKTAGGYNWPRLMPAFLHKAGPGTKADPTGALSQPVPGFSQKAGPGDESRPHLAS